MHRRSRGGPSLARSRTRSLPDQSAERTQGTDELTATVATISSSVLAGHIDGSELSPGSIDAVYREHHRAISACVYRRMPGRAAEVPDVVAEVLWLHRLPSCVLQRCQVRVSLAQQGPAQHALASVSTAQRLHLWHRWHLSRGRRLRRVAARRRGKDQGAQA
jgi:hypothetical protein